MTTRKIMLAGALSLSGLWSAAWGQAPPIPAAAAAPALAAPFPVAPAAVPAQPATLWGFLGISKPQIKECILKKCQTPLGQMMSKAVTPVTALSGGIIPPLCPLVPSAAELADPGVVGEAAKIKAEEAGAKARKAAVRYLGTVDCARFPDAEGALVKALRTDTNECVRYEAALALGNGCCCTKLVMEKLSIAASCSDRDGNPREYSDRVRAAAVSALQNCLSCYVDPNPKQEKTIEGGPAEGQPTPRPPSAQPEELKNAPDTKTTKTDGENKSTAAKRLTPAEYDAKIKEVPMHLIVAEARRVVENYNQSASAQAIMNRQTSLVSIVNNALDSGPMQIIENGNVITRADLASARPNTLWDVLTRQTSPMESSLPAKAEVVINNSAEPPTLVMKSEPMPTPMIRTEPAPMNIAKSEPTPMNVVKSNPAPSVVVKPEPTAVTVTKPESKMPILSNTELKPLNPVVLPRAETKIIMPREAMASRPSAGYGEQTVSRPKTPAELAGMPRGGTVEKVVPAPLPSTVVKDLPRADRQVMKPIEPVEAPEPIRPSPLAQRALTVLAESNSAAVRESVMDTLTSGDVTSSPELVSALVKQAGAGESENARKAAIRSLVRGQVNRPEVMSALEKLTEDTLPTVRVEAAIALARLKLIDAK